MGSWVPLAPVGCRVYLALFSFAPASSTLLCRLLLIASFIVFARFGLALCGGALAWVAMRWPVLLGCVCLSGLLPLYPPCIVLPFTSLFVTSKLQPPNPVPTTPPACCLYNHPRAIHNTRKRAQPCITAYQEPTSENATQNPKYTGFGPIPQLQESAGPYTLRKLLPIA